MKMIVDAETKHIFGAAILGTGGDEAIHSSTHVMYAKASYTGVTHAVRMHRTVAELVPSVLAS